MSYPNYPNNRLIVNGVDLTEQFKMVLVDGYTLEPPTPKLYTIDVPGRNGVIDLTESLIGDTAYNNRKQEFTFYVIGVTDWEKVKTDVSVFLHGRSFDYTMTMDPDYTYHGRFTVSSYEHKSYTIGKVGTIKITIDCDPYKKRANIVKSINAVGGVLYTFTSGRMPIKPTIQTGGNVRVIFDNKKTDLTSGTWIINDVVFKQGDNQMYLCSANIRSLTWGRLKTKGTTFRTFKTKRIFEWYKSESYTPPTAPKVVVEYEWGDL